MHDERIAELEAAVAALTARVNQQAVAIAFLGRHHGSPYVQHRTGGMMLWEWRLSHQGEQASISR